MSELEEKLNALLSDPNSMAQVMQMAQQLSGAMGEQKAAPPPRPEPRTQPPPPPTRPEPAPPPPPAPERQFLNRLLAKLHLGDMDAGDLLLLLILFFLFYQKADEEVLIAIGLLLIL